MAVDKPERQPVVDSRELARKSKQTLPGANPIFPPFPPLSGSDD